MQKLNYFKHSAEVGTCLMVRQHKFENLVQALLLSYTGYNTSQINFIALVYERLQVMHGHRKY